MYNTNYVCFYHDEQKMFPKDDNKLTKEDKDEIADVIYREDLLNAFGLQEFDEGIINAEIEHLYEQMKHLEELHPILDVLASKFMTTDRECGFLVLFSYDYFSFFHEVVCEFLRVGHINKEKIDELTKHCK